MTEIEETISKVDELRKCMYDLLNEKGSLLDTEVILASQKLDKALNEYNKVLSEKE